MSQSKRYKADTFSSLFRTLRKKSGLSLEGLSERTKIQKKYIQYLESGNFHALPPDVYVRGFILKCSTFFGSQTNTDLIELYAIESAAPYDVVQLDPSAKFDGRAFSLTPRHLTIFMSVTFLFSLLVYFLVIFVPFLFKPQILLVHPKGENLVVNFASISIEGMAKYTKSLTFNGEELYIEEDGTFRGDVDLREGVNILKFEAESRFGRSTEVVRKVVYIKN